MRRANFNPRPDLFKWGIILLLARGRVPFSSMDAQRLSL
jgi:hypothetical protein